MLGGRKKYSLASFGCRGGLCDLQECIFLVRCLSFVVCHGRFMNCHDRFEKQIAISIKQEARTINCYANIVKRNTKSVERIGNIVKRIAKSIKCHRRFAERIERK